MIKYTLVLLTSVMFGTLMQTKKPLWCIEDVIIHERKET